MKKRSDKAEIEDYLHYRVANKYGHTFTLPPERENDNVYFLNDTSTFNNLIEELFEVAIFCLRTLRRWLDGKLQVVDVEFAPCLSRGLLRRLQTLVVPSRHLLLQNAPHRKVERVEVEGEVRGRGYRIGATSITLHERMPSPVGRSRRWRKHAGDSREAKPRPGSIGH